MKLLELSGNVKRVELNEEGLLKLIKDSARNSYDAVRRQPIFTKVETKEPYFVVDPAAKARKSSFIVDELITLLPGWRGWTSRLNSVRGWTSRKTAESRGKGELCLLIPFDHARVHVCPETSFYKSFKNSKHVDIDRVDNEGLLAWVKSLYRAGHTINNQLQLEPVEKASQLLKALTKLDDIRHDYLKHEGDKVEKLDDRRAREAFKTKLEVALDRMLDPDDNGFQTYTSLYNLPGEREIWTGAKCIVITLAEYEAMHSRGTIK